MLVAFAPPRVSATEAAGLVRQEKSATPPWPRYEVPYGMAGCGLGNALIAGRGRGAQVAAVLLNLTGLQTLAITSGTSGCVATPDEVAADHALSLYETQKDAVRRESARGGGEVTGAIAHHWACPPAAVPIVARAGLVAFTDGDDAPPFAAYVATLRAQEPTLVDLCPGLSFPTRSKAHG